MPHAFGHLMHLIHNIDLRTQVMKLGNILISRSQSSKQNMPRKIHYSVLKALNDILARIREVSNTWGRFKKN